MTDQYPVRNVSSVEPEWVEQMGSKPKFWFRWPEDAQHAWLFKFSREGTGEDWAEKIAAELASTLQIPAATVELAVFGERRGSISRSFVQRRDGWDLIHGNELLVRDVPGYRREVVFHQSEHTLEHILTVLRPLFTDPSQRRIQFEQLAGYLVLDALIGNTDRHHENWGVLRRTRGDGSVEDRLAPSFDHASSLGRNVPPEERTRRLREGSIGDYALRGKGGIFLTARDRRGANPLELVRRTVPEMREAFQPWLDRLRALSADEIHSIIERVPEAVMDPLAKRFTVAFVDVTRIQLCQL